jgi:Protein of unknown function (DUF3071)
MRQLRFVRSADEGNFVIVETPDGQEQFSLLVDAGLRDAARSDLPRLTPRVVEPPAASVGPREIQTRVRSGESPETIAEEYEIALDRVLRFAGPVLEERARIANEARRARARRSTSDGQTVVFGEAVDERFAAHGIDPTAVSWDARRREDGQWVICAGWRGGDADRMAEWALHLATRTVTPLDETAADLLSDRPIRPVLTPVDGPVRPSLAAAPPLLPGVVAFPVMPDAHTGPLPKADELYDQNAPDLDAPRRPAAPAAAPVPAPAAEPAASALLVGALVDEALVDEATLPLVLPDAEPARLPSVKNLGRAARRAAAEENDEERAARARIPSWDDILLGVRRKGD